MKAIKILSAMVLAMVAVVFSASSADAAQLKSTRLTLSDSRPITSATHTYTFTTNSGADIQEFQFTYCTLPSGTCTTPTSLDTSSAAKGTLSASLGITGNWTADNSVAGTFKLVGTAAVTLAANTAVSIGVTTVQNHAITACTANSSSSTCYVRIVTCDATGVTCGPSGSDKIDEAIVSYTVVAAVTVDARIDPTFTFVVSGVDSNQVNSQISTSVSSAFNSLPFGNLTAGTPKYAAQQLRVTTNTTGGYSVTMKMLNQMTGVYTANNIDPFTANSATATDPKGWTEPTGSTPNTDTGWIGFNTTDTDVTGWSSPNQLFGPVNDTANTVMQDADSDNGSNGVYVTYALEANTFQPADTYQGTLVYNALPTY